MWSWIMTLTLFLSMSFNTTSFTYLDHLQANQVVIPEYIQEMMLLNMIPSEWDHVVAYYVQGQQTVSTITFSTIQTTILSELKHSGGNHNNNQAHTTDKISAVKRKGKSPNFQKQKETADNNYSVEMEAGASDQKKCHLNHHAKKGKGEGNSHQHSYLADRLEKVELGQLQSAPALQHPMIALQPS